jgi:hypothetical protein
LSAHGCGDLMKERKKGGEKKGEIKTGNWKLETRN